jgi:hypothetical protein
MCMCPSSLQKSSLKAEESKRFRRSSKFASSRTKIRTTLYTFMCLWIWPKTSRNCSSDIEGTKIMPHAIEASLPLQWFLRQRRQHRLIVVPKTGLAECHIWPLQTSGTWWLHQAYAKQPMMLYLGCSWHISQRILCPLPRGGGHLAYLAGILWAIFCDARNFFSEPAVGDELPESMLLSTRVWLHQNRA